MSSWGLIMSKDKNCDPRAPSHIWWERGDEQSSPRGGRTGVMNSLFSFANSTFHIFCAQPQSRLIHWEFSSQTLRTCTVRIDWGIFNGIRNDFLTDKCISPDSLSSSAVHHRTDTDRNTFIYFDSQEGGIHKNEWKAFILCNVKQWVNTIPHCDIKISLKTCSVLFTIPYNTIMQHNGC